MGIRAPRNKTRTGNGILQFFLCHIHTHISPSICSLSSRNDYGETKISSSQKPTTTTEIKSSVTGDSTETYKPADEIEFCVSIGYSRRLLLVQISPTIANNFSTSQSNI